VPVSQAQTCLVHTVSNARLVSTFVALGSAMSLISTLKTGFLLCLLAAGSSAYAYDDSLSFRSSPSGGVEAVVSGMSDGPDCRPEFEPPSSVQIVGASVVIDSPDEVRACFIPFAPVAYQVVAQLGVLAGPRYDVVWNQGALQLTGVLIPAALAAAYVPLPTLSRPWLFVFGLALLAVGLFTLSSAHRSRLRSKVAARST
jgi:hypothetical protein